MKPRMEGLAARKGLTRRHKGTKKKPRPFAYRQSASKIFMLRGDGSHDNLDS
jgi:hypothetical protein